MEKKKFQSVSIAALIVSILPLVALAPSLLHLSLSDGVRTAWAGANIVFVLLGLILSVVCVRSRGSRSIINIVSTAISAFWALLMLGIVALGLLSTVIALFGVAVLITYSQQNGAILLVMAFLISPMGLPLAAIWLLGKVQSLKFAIQDWVYG